MRIGLLITSIGNFGQKGFYNAQEVGLAKYLDKLVDEVKVYKLVSADHESKTEQIDGCKNSSIQFIPAKSFGINGKIDIAFLDTTLDAVVYFSDTQFSVPRVYRWAKKNHVAFYPYIGVVESHSTNSIKKIIVDLMFKRNLMVYRKSYCFAKTPAVQKKLQSQGINNVTVAPVGLDLSLLEPDYEKYSAIELKKKYGFCEKDKVLLFIGRLIDEKQPIRMIEVFSEIVERDSSYRLLMVGKGELRNTVDAKIKQLGLNNKVRLLDVIPNSDIWKLYRFSEAFVNLNQQEIFGMAILEAMYYGCKVVAWHAPGPDYIIKNGISGWLVSNNEDLVAKVMDKKNLSVAAHAQIKEQFTWKNTADQFLQVISRKK